MDKKLLEKLKKKLESAKTKTTKQLSSFADKDPKIKGNWRTRFPFLKFGSFSNAEDAEERETYENLLPAEHVLEARLKSINDALRRMDDGGYGRCEKCRSEIGKKRLKAAPEARICLKCGRRK